jgi:hypothetical protein
VTDHPDRFTWRNLRFKQRPPERGDVVRYECTEHSLETMGAYVCLNEHGQWIAKFPHGSYSIEWERDEALAEAVSLAVGGCARSLAVLEALEDYEFARNP